LAISDLRGGTEDESGGLETLAADLRSDGGSVIAVFADLTMAEEIDAAVGTAMAKFGRLDILVNNAAAVHGTDRGGPVLVKVADLDGLWTVNVRAAFLLIQRNTSRGSRWRSTAADSPCDERRHDIAGVEHDGLRRMAPAISTMRKRGGSPAWSVPSHNCDLSCWTA
jgi:NAD(P)-dependent dehydrogenase (short-subunit alcohol dehydrogenase family)